MRTERFPLAPKERAFYEQLSEYLREGYNVAGIHQTRTTRQQRAIGFVMATFQKIMSSSPRAIRQALRRRLLVLLVRKQLSLEARRRSGAATSDAILTIQDEMLRLAQGILGEQTTSTSDAEAYVSQVRRRVMKRFEEDYETTNWSLDNDEEAEEGVYADADIPQERKKTVVTQNYKLGEAMRSHTRDLVFLSATPHQGNPFQFWSLIQLLNDQN